MVGTTAIHKRDQGIFERLNRLFLNRSILTLALAWTVFVAAIPLSAQSTQQRSGDTIVAKVANRSIRLREVWNRIPQKDKIWSQLPVARKKELETAALDALVERAVVFEYLKSYNKTVSETEINLQLDALKAELKTVEQSLAEYLEKRKISEDELRQTIAFSESWRRYLDEKLTDDNLKLHFERNRRKFDGTDVRVAHLVLKKQQNSDSSELQRKASQVLAQLRQKKLTWAEAVKQFSEGTQEKQGELGWIVLKPTMPASITEAAMNLKQGEFSEPIQTVYGVHVLRCLEVTPGKFDFGDAKKRVVDDAKRFLFQSIVGKHRNKVKIERN